MSLANPASLYAAFQILSAGSGGSAGRTRTSASAQCVRAGLELVDYVVAQRLQRGGALDGRRCPGLPRAVQPRGTPRGRGRYRALSPQAGGPGDLCPPGPAAAARRVRRHGARSRRSWCGTSRASTTPSAACSSRTGRGATRTVRATAMGSSPCRSSSPRATRQLRRAILSVTPDSGVSLRGLGERLDRAEARAPPRDPRRGRPGGRPGDRAAAAAANRLQQRRPVVRRPGARRTRSSTLRVGHGAVGRRDRGDLPRVRRGE